MTYLDYHDGHSDHAPHPAWLIGGGTLSTVVMLAAIYLRPSPLALAWDVVDVAGAVGAIACFTMLLYFRLRRQR